MRIKYKVSLRSSKFTKEFYFQEKQTVRIGTQQDCHLILPPSHREENYFFTIYSSRSQIAVECSPNMRFSLGQKISSHAKGRTVPA